MKNKLAIIIVNWRRYDDTAECLRSVKASNYRDPRIILVDNASTDGSGEKLAKEFPDIKVIFNQENYGFAEGNNIGIKQALKEEAKYIMLLNNDAVLDRDCLGNLMAAMENELATGIIGPKIYFYDTDSIWYAGGMVSRLTGLPYHIGEGRLDRGQFSKPGEVDYATGCALLARREVFERVGLLDKDFYHNHEDAEFCLRAKAAGFAVAYEPSAVV
ncbi:MAG: glycosyltransferase family 2 protein, partial [Candidatus Margulisbacteria bacterium]|nr:glycosyltransferase family 2 protein [Candidatus Margulisiibacteriota bacterium]